MTRLEMQERIGTGPYRVLEEEDGCDDNAAFGACIVDSYEQWVTKPLPLIKTIAEYQHYSDRLDAICDALNALWETAQ